MTFKDEGHVAYIAHLAATFVLLGKCMLVTPEGSSS